MPGSQLTTGALDALDIGWIAGIIEGEGHIGVHADKRHGFGYPRISVKMTDRDVIERLHGLCGGRVHGPVIKGDFKPAWNWRLSDGKSVARLLLAIYPVLGTRRRAAVAAVLSDLERVSKVATGRNKCGTYAGYQHHSLRQEPICSPCREAQRVYMREFELRHPNRRRKQAN